MEIQMALAERDRSHSSSYEKQCNGGTQGQKSGASEETVVLVQAREGAFEIRYCW
jgi:hypothetical protein